MYLLVYFETFENTSVFKSNISHVFLVALGIIHSHVLFKWLKPSHWTTRGILCIAVGEVMRDSSTEFAADPCSLSKRGSMVRAARALLSAVTRLLILADMVDVHLLLKSLRMVGFYTKFKINVTSSFHLQTIINLYFIS